MGNDELGWDAECEFHPLYLLYASTLSWSDPKRRVFDFRDFWERQRDADGLPEVWQ